MRAPGLRGKLGCWLHERWRAELVMRTPFLAQACGLCWLDLRNRNERLRKDLVTGGRICEWMDTGRLTVARIFPRVGIRLLRHVLREWPIEFEQAGSAVTLATPIVSILIPVGGQARMAQFELALAAALAQQGVACEVLVIEQWPTPALRENLPADVRYLHQPVAADTPFNKSSALNAGACVATGNNLILLDADYILPSRFAAECARALEHLEAVRPARWIFYLDRASSERLAESRDSTTIEGVEAVVSNNPTPLALRSTAYWAIGGHDESYVGWGGEDTEFLDRLRTRNVGEGGWMPILHAWHAPAPKKADGDRNRQQHAVTMALPAHERILGLRERQQQTGVISP